MSPNKACAVLLDPEGRLLLFRHPRGDVQLVKGTIEVDEPAPDAALRELREESGIAPAQVIRDLGCWDARHHGQVWSFQLCATDLALPERWSHQTEDDHGHVFDFFWASQDRLPFADCHPLFRRALRQVLDRLEEA
ncbi:NUDIX domain-containing protein [Pseudomonas sp. 148P]|uniref:NUDIX domain-containing protein n=1 Tax=Pseudomonas ulcerans TaxID=3115852 RepID=A0ABU7HUD1_9PSED|nr:MULTISPECIES: NUDIX domain-containing protein [unclassified Pseudomonas]MEE1923937.1 NUDIX domain-containing protein [Pseudomonas sp. 147P]MEE1935114.1 NUDIX domain-containing protein [Pseudomonas sp. 148P]